MRQEGPFMIIYSPALLACLTAHFPLHGSPFLQHTIGSSIGKEPDAKVQEGDKDQPGGVSELLKRGPF